MTMPMLYTIETFDLLSDIRSNALLLNEEVIIDSSSIQTKERREPSDRIRFFRSLLRVGSNLPSKLSRELSFSACHLFWSISLSSFRSRFRSFRRSVPDTYGGKCMRTPIEREVHEEHG